MGGQKQPTTAEKALQINLDPSRHGTFSEIGAEQEIVRRFLRAGGADEPIAKSSPILICHRSLCELVQWGRAPVDRHGAKAV